MGLRSFDILFEAVILRHDDDPWHRNKWITV